MEHTLTVLPGGEKLSVPEGSNLLDVLRQAGLAPEAPCGGKGTCGKCRVTVDGEIKLACRTLVDRDRTVALPPRGQEEILSRTEEALAEADGELTGNALAIDLGTTTMVCYLLDRWGRELAAASSLNPQRAWGGDVISRIQAAIRGDRQELCRCVRQELESLMDRVCRDGGVRPEDIQNIALVGNPCMQQLLLDIPVDNLASPPFAPLLTEMKTLPAEAVFPGYAGAELLVAPDISGFVGADTLGCVLSTRMYEGEQMTLMVDIGTNGEMVLGNRQGMIACSAAAGPALEGANIRFGMRGSTGAIDRVDRDGRVHVIGGGKAAGICGSGLVDAVDWLLDRKLLNCRGRLENIGEFEGQRAWFLTEEICLTQADIRQVQLAKGAIAAGIQLMAEELGIGVGDIDRVLLAGAFGTCLDPESACKIGLLPEELLSRVRAVGNAAGAGAKLLAISQEERKKAEELCRKIRHLELASLPRFPKTFGKHTNFG